MSNSLDINGKREAVVVVKYNVVRGPRIPNIVRGRSQRMFSCILLALLFNCLFRWVTLNAMNDTYLICCQVKKNVSEVPCVPFHSVALQKTHLALLSVA